MPTDLPSPVSAVSKRETQAYSWGASGLFVVLFLIYSLTAEPPLSPPALFLFGVVSMMLAVGYLVITPRSLRLPRHSAMKVRIQYPLISISWAVLFFLLLHGHGVIYFYIAEFDEYVSFALFHSRRWALGWACVLMGIMAAVHVLAFGIAGALKPFSESIPLYLLICGLAELVVRLWEEREQAESLTAELEKAYQQLQDAAAQAEALAVAQERVRLAHEVHDTMGHTLTALGLQLELLHKLPSEKARERQIVLERSRELVKGAQAEVWRAVQALQPPPLETLCLSEAMQQLIDNFVQRFGRQVTWVEKGNQAPLPSTNALALYRALQEGLTNIQRHAPDARTIDVSLEFGDSDARLTVENGPSTNPSAGQSPRSATGGFGLRGLKERIESVGGTFHAGPTPEGGFLLEATVPLFASQ
jgi:signal transduction histidine kinase